MSEHDSITIIGRGAHIKGEITFDTPARILGTIEGTIFSKTELYIGQTAHCKAAVHASVMLVDGSVEGALIASERIELTANCCVKGDITTGSLVVADGASFMGFCRVGPEALNEQNVAVARAQSALNAPATPAPSLAPAAPAHEQSRMQDRVVTHSNGTANGASNGMGNGTGHAAPATNGTHTTRPASTPDRIVIPDKPGVEVKNQPGTTQPRPRARTADWLPPATPAFPSVVTKTNDWNGSPANA